MSRTSHRLVQGASIASALSIASAVVWWNHHRTNSPERVPSPGIPIVSTLPNGEPAPSSPTPITSAQLLESSKSGSVIMLGPDGLTGSSPAPTTTLLPSSKYQTLVNGKTLASGLAPRKAASPAPTASSTPQPQDLPVPHQASPITPEVLFSTSKSLTIHPSTLLGSSKGSVILDASNIESSIGENGAEAKPVMPSPVPPETTSPPPPSLIARPPANTPNP